MNEEELKNLILQHLHQIAPEADLDTLDPNADIRLELDIDSMDFFRLLVGLSEELKKDIPEEEYAKLTSVEKIVGHLKG